MYFIHDLIWWGYHSPSFVYTGNFPLKTQSIWIRKQILIRQKTFYIRVCEFGNVVRKIFFEIGVFHPRHRPHKLFYRNHYIFRISYWIDDLETVKKSTSFVNFKMTYLYVLKFYCTKSFKQKFLSTRKIIVKVKVCCLKI